MLKQNIVFPQSSFLQWVTMNNVLAGGWTWDLGWGRAGPRVNFYWLRFPVNTHLFVIHSSSKLIPQPQLYHIPLHHIIAMAHFISIYKLSRFCPQSKFQSHHPESAGVKQSIDWLYFYLWKLGDLRYTVGGHIEQNRRKMASIVNSIKAKQRAWGFWMLPPLSRWQRWSISLSATI